MRDSTQLFGTMSGVLHTFQGTTVARETGGRISVYFRNMRGGFCPAAVYIDGRWQRDQDELSWLRTDDIATVEIYPRVGTVPPEFIPLTTEPCGSLVIWTKANLR